MTGPEHYIRAEELLKEAEGEPSTRKDRLIDAAGVHATLALVAVTAEPRVRLTNEFGAANMVWCPEDTEAWSEAIQ